MLTSNPNETLINQLLGANLEITENQAKEIAKSLVAVGIYSIKTIKKLEDGVDTSLLLGCLEFDMALVINNYLFYVCKIEAKVETYKNEYLQFLEENNLVDLDFQEGDFTLDDDDLENAEECNIQEDYTYEKFLTERNLTDGYTQAYNTIVKPVNIGACFMEMSKTYNYHKKAIEEIEPRYLFFKELMTDFFK